MEEDLRLDALEARVLGVLIEKASTTPDQYPLSLNATTVACNQKSNRHPVLELSESEVSNAVGKLIVRGLAGRVLQAGSRVERFRHNGPERLGLTEPALAVLAELLLRGPQNPGELRQRASRMCEMPTLEDLRTALRPLLEKGIVQELSPSPGSRAERFVQLLAPGIHPLEGASAERVPRIEPPSAPGASRIEALESEVARLRRQLEGLAKALGEELSD